jgi:Protein affecting phage T7 exclusion by the F plasmid
LHLQLYYLFFPGFITDIIGFLFIFPFSRKLIFDKFVKKINKKKNNENNFIDGEFEDIDDDNDRKI